MKTKSQIRAYKRDRFWIRLRKKLFRPDLLLRARPLSIAGLTPLPQKDSKTTRFTRFQPHPPANQ